MNTIAILVLCVQACFVQKAFSQCSGGYGAEVINNPGSGYETAIPIAPAAGLISSRCGNPASLGYGVAAIGLGNAGIGSYGFPAAGLGNVAAYGATSGAAYGGAGEGNVAVAGDLPVGGATTVIGEVPILGAVNFGGNLPAAGAVSITANCACGCGGY